MQRARMRLYEQVRHDDMSFMIASLAPPFKRLGARYTRLIYTLPPAIFGGENMLLILRYRWKMTRRFNYALAE